MVFVKLMGQILHKQKQDNHLKKKPYKLISDPKVLVVVDQEVNPLLNKKKEQVKRMKKLNVSFVQRLTKVSLLMRIQICIFGKIAQCLLNASSVVKLLKSRLTINIQLKNVIRQLNLNNVIDAKKASIRIIMKSTQLIRNV